MLTGVEVYGIYLSHYLEDNIFPDANPWDYTFIGGVNFAITMFLAPFLTISCRKFSIYAIMCCGLLLAV